MNVALIFGGLSVEHEVSITSAMGIFTALKSRQHNVTLIGIDLSGTWRILTESEFISHKENPRLLNLLKISGFTTPDVALKNIDIVFPILHGTFGEDGTLQGLLEMLRVPYVGCGVLSSSLCMDKILTKTILQANGIPVVPFVSFTRKDWMENQKEHSALIKNLGYPHFIKPANSGSSVGITKAKSELDTIKGVELALQYDNYVLVEKCVVGRELECAVLGNSSPKASCVGEIVCHHEFYSYEAKYLDPKGATSHVPAQNLPGIVSKKIQDLAEKSFSALQCSGLARVDFFYVPDSGEVFINEINTMPGFTPISLYPQMWIQSGVTFQDLIENLLKLGLETSQNKKILRHSFVAK